MTDTIAKVRRGEGPLDPRQVEDGSWGWSGYMRVEGVDGDHTYDVPTQSACPTVGGVLDLLFGMYRQGQLPVSIGEAVGVTIQLYKEVY